MIVYLLNTKDFKKGVLNELCIHHIHYSDAFGFPVRACTNQLTCVMHFQLSHRNRNIILLKYAQINEAHPVTPFIILELCNAESQDSQFFTITSGFYEWKTTLLYSPSTIIIIMSTSVQEDMLEDGYSLLSFFKHEILLQVNIL